MKRMGCNSAKGLDYFLDRRDFRDLLGKTLYGLLVLTPGGFLHCEREAGGLI